MAQKLDLKNIICTSVVPPIGFAVSDSYNNYLLLRPAREFFTYTETSPLGITGEGLQNLGLCSFEQGGMFIVTRGLGFSGLIRRTTLFSRLLRHTWGCGGSILTRMLTSRHSFASYDTQGDDEDLFLP
jgi:hypothetical protein